MSPVEMIEATLQARPGQRIKATLHPREVYEDADLVALDRISRDHPRFSLVQGAAEDLLATCDHVVTQNSSVAMLGYFVRKPAVLFAGIDFHHIAGSVPRDGLEAAFAQVQGEAPEYDAYLTWFLRRNCVNGGAPEAEAQILARFARFGWPVGGM
jgi:hypothetical protein